MQTLLPFDWRDFDERAMLAAGWRLKTGRTPAGFYAEIWTLRGPVRADGCASLCVALDCAVGMAAGAKVEA